MTNDCLRIRRLAVLALLVAHALAGCAVNPVPTPAKTTGVGAQGGEDNNGVPTGLADAAEPGKANDGTDGTQMAGASDAAPPAADATVAQDGVGEVGSNEAGRTTKD